jgi:hypothetical protein
MRARVIGLVTTLVVLMSAVPAHSLGAGHSSKPTLRATHAIAIGGSRAVLLGNVDPHGLNTAWYFQLGTTKAYGLPLPRASLEQPLEGHGANAVEEAVSCLAPKTTYHFRLVARNKAGKTYGPDHTFRTERLLGSPETAYGLCPGNEPLK